MSNQASVGTAVPENAINTILSTAVLLAECAENEASRSETIAANLHGAVPQPAGETMGPPCEEGIYNQIRTAQTRTAEATSRIQIALNRIEA